MLPTRRMTLLFTLLLVIALSSSPVAPYAANDQVITETQTQASMAEQLNEVLDDPRLKGALAGVSVRSAETGEILYAHQDQIRMTPASNQKLLTGAAALNTLGPDHTFETLVLTDGELRGNVLHGNLYLKGKGDPTLLKEDFEHFAEALKEQGIESVKGDLVGDDTWYDDVRLSQDLAWDNESSYAGAQVSALSASPNDDYDAGTVIVEVHASEIEEPTEVKVVPQTEYVNIINRTETVEEGGPRKISVYREHGTNDIIVEGTMPTDGFRYRTWVSVWEPTGYALDLFQQSLAQTGIRIMGKENALGPTPEGTQTLVSHESMPLSELFIPFMKLSNNGHAEILIKEMGKQVHDEGSWPKGLQVVSDYLEDIGLDAEGIRLRDGSGMSHLNMVPAQALTELLYLIQDEPWYDVFLEGLPVAGESDRMVGGTLRNRMGDTPADGNVIAKTGSLTAKTSLSGYVTTADGHDLTFAVLFNNYMSNSPKDLEDEIAVRLASITLEQ
ncbi:D-alanyl-D-alanine carboxypeptidase/D-alanyl-D-alanine-endopeptidase [Caldalkalibacillus salinus]|uniref:D-alanyl-D-alanine carboxypeptidase/D-alanyl-D-alanine endopeptidase n=1 Tax=Caldalkalibacillus salinus TaxID=2803787 RepID=UPI001923C742|nr:D-alanyl-D-alanine carboxypeptidase/D-alanyl-D-alanine-endopeptidase [Caldalkalibacillus salinus]